MTPAQKAWRQIMIELDVKGAHRLWGELFAHLPRAEGDHDMLITLHVLRTQDEMMIPRLRYYSHRWLEDHGHPSHLPNRLKPAAVKMFPDVRKAVGIAMAGNAGDEACSMIRKQMEIAALEVEGYGDLGKREIELPHIMRARFRERKALGLPQKWEIPAEWRP